MTWSPSRGPGGIAISSSRACGPLRVVRLGEELLVGRQPGLALGLAGPGAHPDPFELTGERALARVGLLLLVRHAVELLLEPARVVAAERDPPPAIELEDPLGHVVEEVAVVSHRDDRAVVLVEEALEPVDRLGVEMVRRLVEEQQIGVLEEQPGQRDAPSLAAAQGRDGRVVRRAAERLHGDFDVAFDVPGVGRVDPVLEGGLLGADRLVVGVRLGPLRHHGVVGVDQPLDLGHAVHDVALDVLGGVELRLLRQVADGEPRRQAGVAREPVVEAGHDLQEARFARPVRPDDADLGARVERERDVLEDRPVRRVVPGEAIRGVDELGRHVAAKPTLRDGRGGTADRRPAGTGGADGVVAGPGRRDHRRERGHRPGDRARARRRGRARRARAPGARSGSTPSPRSTRDGSSPSRWTSGRPTTPGGSSGPPSSASGGSMPWSRTPGSGCTAGSSITATRS